jgi:hypothetical protein
MAATVKPQAMLTIRFIGEGDLVSRLIEWATGSLWCHTEGLSRGGCSWIGAHAGSGVALRPLYWVTPRRERRYAIPVSQAAYDNAMTWLESQIGVKYDYLDCIGLAIRKRTWNPRRLICSELMVEFMQAAGLAPLNVLPGFDALITPEVLHLSPIFIGRCVGQIP